MKTMIQNLSTKIKLMTMVAAIILVNEAYASDGKKEVKKTVKTETENEVVLENWMTNLKLWNLENNSKTLVNSYPTSATSRKTSLSESNCSSFDIETEEELVLENWMLNAGKKFWNVNGAQNSSVESDDMEIEDWMTDLSKW